METKTLSFTSETLSPQLCFSLNFDDIKYGQLSQDMLPLSTYFTRFKMTAHKIQQTFTVAVVKNVVLTHRFTL